MFSDTIYNMKTYLKTLLLSAFFSACLFTSAQNVDKFFDTDENRSVQIIINGEKVSVQSLPQNGFVEVFNILGSKMMTFQINGGKSSTRINLPKGYYILKSDDATRKIVVK